MIQVSTIEITALIKHTKKLHARRLTFNGNATVCFSTESSSQ